MPDGTTHTERAETLLTDLRNSHRQLKQQSRLSSLFVFAGILLIGLSLLLLAEQSLYLQPAVKSTFWALLLIAASVSAWWLSRYRDDSDFIRFYRSFCEKHDLRNLENALDLYHDPPERRSGMHALAISRNLQEAERDRIQTKLKEFTRDRPSHRTFISTGILFLAGLFLAAGASWSDRDSLSRTIGFWQEYEKPNPWEFVITPGDTTLEHGSSIVPEIEFTGGRSSLPGRVSLAIKTDIEEEYRLRPMERTDSDGRTLRSSPVELTSNATWYVVMDGFESDRYEASVQLRPRFEELTVRVDPPAYTNLPATTRDYPFAQLRAYGGSEITISGTYNKPVEESALHLSNETLELETGGDSLSFEASFTLSGSDTLRFAMRDRDGLTNQNPFRFTLQLLNDEYPVVSILEPDEDLMIPEPDRLDLIYQASDDFGLTRANLHWELQRAFTTEQVEDSRQLDRPVNGDIQHVPWELADLELRPRDRLTFWISVWDNDEFNGYKVTASQRVSLEVPSLSAWLDDIGERERGVQETLDEVSDSHDQMEQEFESFRERLIQNQDTGWEEEQMLEDIISQHSDMEDAVNRLNEQFEEIRNEIQNSSQVSDATRQAYQELQELMEQLDDPELLRALEELRRSMENMNSRELQEALENFEFNDQVYRERLQRTVELFKTLKMNSDLDRLAAQYEDLSERMRSVSETDRDLQEKQEEQQNVREDTETLERQLEELDSRPPNRSEERLRQLKEESLGELQDIQQKIDDLIRQGLEETSQEEPDSDPAGQSGDTADNGETGDENGDGTDESGEGSENGNAEEGGDGTDGESGENGEPGQNGEGEDESGDNGEPAETGGESPGQQDPRQQQQQEISEQFQARADALRDAQQQMGGQQIQVNILALQQSLYTLLELSDVQEDLSRKTNQTESRSQGYVALARDQQNIRSQFSRVADTLFQVSSEIPSLSGMINTRKAEVERTLGNAVDQMAERDQRMSVVTSRESLGGINELASLLAEAIDQLMDQQSGMGGGDMSLQQMIEQMQNMSGDQELMNQQLQDLINDAQGERLTQEQSERLDQLARQQNEIRRQLQEMQRSGALRDGDRALSEMQRMAEEMEDAINDMRGGMTDPLMTERQQNILSRMLDAEESLQERGESEQYEGRTPNDYDRTMPPEISLEEIEQEIRARLQDPEYTRFHDDYQRLIERYFELLRRMENNQLP